MLSVPDGNDWNELPAPGAIVEDRVVLGLARDVVAGRHQSTTANTAASITSNTTTPIASFARSRPLARMSSSIVGSSWSRRYLLGSRITNPHAHRRWS